MEKIDPFQQDNKVEKIEIQERVITDIKLPFSRVLHLVIQFAVAQLLIAIVLAIPIFLIWDIG